MSAAVANAAIDSSTLTVEPIDYWVDVRHRFVRNRLAVFGLMVLGALVLLAIVGPFALRGDYRTARNGLENQGLFSEGGVFGTDDLGRDIFRRVVRGLGISLGLAVSVTTATTIVGMLLGGLAGFFGGVIDNVVSRIIDALYAVPYVLIGIAFLAIFRGRIPSFWIVFASLVAVQWTSTARVFRAAVLQVTAQDYLEAARATGATTKRILLGHVLPNAIPPIIVTVAFSVAGAILSESIYSFLGIGFVEPTPAIGVMVRAARATYDNHPNQLFVPASVLILLTLSIVLIGDGLRDALDPKLRGSN